MQPNDLDNAILDVLRYLENVDSSARGTKRLRFDRSHPPRLTGIVIPIAVLRYLKAEYDRSKQPYIHQKLLPGSITLPPAK